MNVTDKEIKYRQPLNEGYLQKVPAEQEGYAEAYDSLKITESNNNINTDLPTERLLEKILNRHNMNQAYRKVKANKGAGGVDGMRMDELLQHLKENGQQLIQAIKDGKYHPNPVRRVEIPKEEKGKVRKLGIPTLVDRVVQQAIAQILTPIFEEQFSDNSFGFRPKRNAHDAIRRCQKNVDEGYKYVVDMDLEKYFDTVNQSKLIEVLSRTIKDGRVISLIHKFLRAGVIVRHKFEETGTGVPQGGPLSPLLSNIMLNELDKELEQRGHKFVRYADDMMVFCKSRKSATRTLENILPYIEEKLFLKVNRTKTVIDYIGKVKFLGFTFYRYKGLTRVRIHPKAITKMKMKIRDLTARNNGWGEKRRIDALRRYIIGWTNYFKIADIKNLLKEMDEWMRRRIRMIYWKRWKKIKTRFWKLKHYGIDENKAWEFANTRKGCWRVSNSPILKRTLNNQVLSNRGYIFFFDYYQQVCVN